MVSSRYSVLALLALSSGIHSDQSHRLHVAKIAIRLHRIVKKINAKFAVTGKSLDTSGAAMIQARGVKARRDFSQISFFHGIFWLFRVRAEHFFF